MRDLDLKSMRLLVAVCEHQNIKKAAAEEHIEPSAISKRIAQLEQAVGTPLLLRGRRGVHPTPAGQALLEHARTLLHTVQRIESDIAAFQGGMRGHVRIVASISAIAESLLDDIARFMGEPAHRDIKVDIEERISSELVRSVRDGRATLGVCWDHTPMEGLQTLPYRRDELALAVHAGHPLADKSSVRFAQTLDYQHVGLPPNTAVYAMLQRAAARLNRSIDYRVVVSSFDAAFRVVAAHLGISIVPRQLSAIYASAGQVRIIPLADSWAERQFAICFPQLDNLPAPARRMVEFLAARARPEQP
ncbi:LysR family transcriptional regulator [Aquincola sp. S2]|uniref:LysR family transcriptional regulator n=1 Tax=Pseudaquabacterium terrae TaxID=2732868 RepID=A0ABX2EGJ3_9BURK|nr:LysR family transcriptional regulator [Aquabacterium terrae]NRF67770.1 LysR family transcriptional regulator [Aquabacterium terrae]